MTTPDDGLAARLATRNHQGAYGARGGVMGLFDFMKPAKPITYEIRKIDGFGYVPVYHQHIGNGFATMRLSWCISPEGCEEIMLSRLCSSDEQYFYKTEVGAGKVIDLHSQLRGGKTVWSA